MIYIYIYDAYDGNKKNLLNKNNFNKKKLIIILIKVYIILKLKIK